MTVNLSNILAGLEAKITAMDSNTPLDDMILNLKSYQEAGGKLAAIYDSAGTLPAADSDYTGMMVYANNALYMFNGNRWDEADSDTIYPPPPPWSYQGLTEGFVTAGYYVTPSYSNGYLLDVEKFSLTSDTDATNLGNINRFNTTAAGASSATHSYTAGGYNNVDGRVNIIDKIPFAAADATTDVGDLSSVLSGLAGTNDEFDGFVAGGMSSPSGSTNAIQTWPFSSDTNATSSYTLTVARTYVGGNSSSTHGYTAGGSPTGPGTGINTIDKFPFAYDANASDVGDLIATRSRLTTQSSAENGYGFGSAAGAPYSAYETNIIEKYPFATDANSALIGSISPTVPTIEWSTGISSSSYGYGVGGSSGSISKTLIQKFPFASDADASDAADLSTARHQSVGTQH